VGSLTQKGTGFGGWEGPLLPRFAFEASSHPCVMGLSNVERRWIACRWSDLMQVATWGSAMSMCAFQVSLIVGSPHQRWVTFVLFVGTRGSCLRRVRMGNEVMPFVGSRWLVLSLIGRKAPLSCDGSPTHKRDDELHIRKVAVLVTHTSR
jgi:hypothetical protein